ncbi:MAG TPA: peptidoglycan DD-metalloendopeptidase family protein [Saprospiraceae bacterium]|nr:peptidoglycan DD-metalloendopeptidase family protein [Saprospiraceae bacterium]
MENAERSNRTSLISRKKLLIGFSGLFLVTVLLALRFSQANQQLLGASVNGDTSVQLGAFPIAIPTLKYGFALDTFQVHQDTFRRGQYLGDILLKHNIDYPTIQQIAANADTVFKINRFRVNHPYTVLSRDTAQGGDYFIYEPNAYEYVVFALQGDLAVRKVKRPIATRSFAKGGSIESSLWAAMAEIGEGPDLFVKLEDALQWSVDFHRIQKGDQFKAVYDKNYIDDKAVGAGMVHAAYYKTGEAEFYAIYYDDSEEHAGYYDLEGRPMNKGFLKSPVKASRISSPFNPNRFHPILKRRRPHLGTDYAAPHGTPIRAVGDGVVIKASYSNGNGNYVKIKHNDTYQTQYLHMSGFAEGIAAGVHVQQGQTIGYVGATGLATGPHVCFRFWKNGRQVNHLRLNFPPPEPLPEKELEKFFAKRDVYLAQLKNIEVQKSQQDNLAVR